MAVTLTGCAAAPAPSLTNPVGVERGASQAVVAPDSVRPTGELMAIAQLGVEVATVLPVDLQACAGLLTAIRAARTKHPAPAGYALTQVAGWRFLAGWWIQDGPDGLWRLRVTVEDAGDTPPFFDVTDDGNYGPDLQPGFPAALERTHVELDHALPSGPRLAASLVAPLGDAGQNVDVVGTGAINALAPLGSVGIEALNARLGPDGRVQKGEVVLRNLAAGTITQFNGNFAADGLVSATLNRSARQAAELVKVDGRWQVRNATGTYPL